LLPARHNYFDDLLNLTNKNDNGINKLTLLSIPVTENDVVAVSKKIVRADAKNP